MFTSDRSSRLQDIMKEIKFWCVYIQSDILNKLSKGYVAKLYTLSYTNKDLILIHLSCLMDEYNSFFNVVDLFPYRAAFWDS